MGWSINLICQSTSLWSLVPVTQIPFPSKKLDKSQLQFYPLKPLFLNCDIYKVVENQNRKPLFVFSRRQKQKFKETKTLQNKFEFHFEVKNIICCFAIREMVTMSAVKRADQRSHKYSVLIFLWHLLEHSGRMNPLTSVKESLVP